MRDHAPHDPFERRPGRGERGPRVFAPGDLKLLMLSMLAEQPGHGYDLIRQIEGLFDGVRMRIELSKRALRGHDRPPEINEAVGNLRHALHMHSGRWTPEEIERVRGLLNDTAKAIAGGPTDSVQEKTP